MPHPFRVTVFAYLDESIHVKPWGGFVPMPDNSYMKTFDVYTCDNITISVWIPMDDTIIQCWMPGVDGEDLGEEWKSRVAGTKLDVFLSLAEEREVRQLQKVSVTTTIHSIGNIHEFPHLAHYEVHDNNGRKYAEKWPQLKIYNHY